MSVWLMIVAAGLVTFTTRISFIYLLGKREIPDWFRRALRFVPVTVLSAITLPELVVRNGTFNLSFGNPQLLAGAVAVVVAWRTKNVLLTIAAGMAALLVIQALLAYI
jgi:branched-subunit amino acid transport protein